MAGYSGTPLASKLGIKTGTVLATIDEPANYRKLLAPLPDGVRIVNDAETGAHIVHHFVTRRSELVAALHSCRNRLAVTTPVWISWPRKSAQLATDITENTIREVALPFGYVDVKVCAVSEIWSGLKLVVRKELRETSDR